MKVGPGLVARMPLPKGQRNGDRTLVLWGLGVETGRFRTENPARLTNIWTKEFGDRPVRRAEGSRDTLFVGGQQRRKELIPLNSLSAFQILLGRGPFSSSSSSSLSSPNVVIIGCNSNSTGHNLASFLFLRIIACWIICSDNTLFSFPQYPLFLIYYKTGKIKYHAQCSPAKFLFLKHKLEVLSLFFQRT